MPNPKKYLEYQTEKAARYCEDVSLVKLVTAFVVTVFLFAFLYYLGGFSHNVSSEQKENITFVTSLYLSVVTISSLGYGDVSPTGFSRLAASIEVVLGLAFMGLIVAKLTSSRISYHVRRLYEANIRVRLAEINIKLNGLKGSMSRIVKEVTSIYVQTPNSKESHKGSEADMAASMTAAIGQLQLYSISTKDCFSVDVTEGRVDLGILSDLIIETSVLLESIVRSVGLTIAYIPAENRMRILEDSDNHFRLLDSMENIKSFGRIFGEPCKIAALEKNITTLLKVTESFPQELFNVPTQHYNQPDQVLEAQPIVQDPVPMQ